MKAPASVLLVDDDPAFRQVMGGEIGRMGYEVASAGSGEEALQKLAKLEPHVVLLDLRLPGMNGLDVCRELRRKGFDAPIIMLTAKAEEVDRVVGLEIGADDYVTKPFGIRELLALHRADAIASGTSLAAIEYCERMLRDTPPEELNPPPVLTGEDLIAAGLKPGPEFKRLLDAVREAQLEGRVKSKEEAHGLVQQFRSTPSLPETVCE